MSSPAVRKWFEEQIKFIVAEAPFMDTIGTLTTKKSLPDLWSTLEFGIPGSQRLTVGSPAIYREYGTVGMLLMVRSGAGASEVTRYLQKMHDLMLEKRAVLTEEGAALQGTLRIDNVSPPTTEPYEDGNWLIGSVACVYTYDSVRGAVVV